MPRGKTAPKKVVKKASSKKSEDKLSTAIFNQKGEKLKTVILPKSIFGQKSNPILISQAVRVYLANQKAKLASTKTRGEVAGGGRKPHRQKGTGRARAGSIRSAGRVGGGIIFGPQPVKSLLKLTKKMRQKALAIALSDKLREEKIILLDKLTLKEPKTKKAKEILIKTAGTNRKTLLILGEKDPIVMKSFKNLEEVDFALPLDLNTLNVLKSSRLIFTIEAIEKLKSRFGGSVESN